MSVLSSPTRISEVEPCNDSFDLRLRRVKRKSAAKGELIDEKALTKTTWPAWQNKVDRWRQDQAKYMPLLGLEAPQLSASTDLQQQHGEDASDDDSDDSDDDTSDDAGKSPHPTQIPVSAGTPLPSLPPSPQKLPKGRTRKSDKCDPEGNEVLGLPSDFSPEEIDKYDLRTLAEYEACLLVGQAFDQLEVVRRTVMHLSAFVDAKKDTARGRKANMRANDLNRYSESVRDNAAHKYNHIYDRLIKVQAFSSPLRAGAANPGSYLKRINLSTDLTISNMKVAREQGDRSRSGSWIWWAFEDAMNMVEVSASVDDASASNSKSARPNKRTRSQFEEKADTILGSPRVPVESSDSSQSSKKYMTWCTS